MKLSKGFTLIELLVVIAIIGLLSSVVTGSLNSARQKARVAKMNVDARNIQTQMILARLNADTVLLGVTGSACTSCSFSAATTMQSQASALTFNAARWATLGFTSAPLDPWGNPYTFDENEHEGGTGNCTKDAVYSAGPNGILQGNVANSSIQPGVVTAGAGDDFYFNVVGFSCP